MIFPFKYYKYFSPAKAEQDIKTLNEILSRQGYSLFIDVMAENFADDTMYLKYEKIFGSDHKIRKMIALVDEFKNSLQERL